MLSRKHRIYTSAFALALCALPGLAQDAVQTAEEPSSGWRKFDDSAPAEAAPVGAELTLAIGTWITVRVDQELSSDHNLEGDAFTATLVQPLVVNGIVVARRGQTAGGRVTEAQKAGRSKGTSRLGVELAELSLVDGQQVPVKTRFIEYQAGTSVGRDVGAVATTTGMGAAIGAAAEGGVGAGIGALAGAAAGMIGVLATRGKATVVYPETVLTFRLEEPLTISTVSSARAFRPVAPQDYEQKTLNRQRRATAPPRRPYYYGGWSGRYDPFFYPRFYGPSLYLHTGPRFFARRGGRR